jgi:hypothetical protein
MVTGMMLTRRVLMHTRGAHGLTRGRNDRSTHDEERHRDGRQPRDHVREYR